MCNNEGITAYRLHYTYITAKPAFETQHITQSIVNVKVVASCKAYCDMAFASYD